MKRFASFVSMVIVLISTLSCGKSSDMPAVDSAQSQSAPEWRLQMKSVCQDQPLDTCLAGYGYAVAADGSYRVGPGPDGQVLTGALLSDEVDELHRLTTDAFASAASLQAQMACQDGATSSSSDTVTWILRTGQSQEWLRTGPKEFCASLSSSDLARKLYEFVQKSASRHYPLPFPGDTCDEATATLDALYGSVQKCAADLDCSYHDESVLPVAPSTFTFVLTGDCTGAKPLVIGNRALVAEQRPLILQQIVRAREACKSRSITSCKGFSEFQPTQPAPVCRAGVCRLPQDS